MHQLSPFVEQFALVFRVGSRVSRAYKLLHSWKDTYIDLFMLLLLLLLFNFYTILKYIYIWYVWRLFEIFVFLGTQYNPPSSHLARRYTHTHINITIWLFFFFLHCWLNKTNIISTQAFKCLFFPNWFRLYEFVILWLLCLLFQSFNLFLFSFWFFFL